MHVNSWVELWCSWCLASFLLPFVINGNENIVSGIFRWNKLTNLKVDLEHEHTIDHYIWALAYDLLNRKLVLQKSKSVQDESMTIEVCSSILSQVLKKSCIMFWIMSGGYSMWWVGNLELQECTLSFGSGSWRALGSSLRRPITMA